MFIEIRVWDGEDEKIYQYLKSKDPREDGTGGAENSNEIPPQREEPEARTARGAKNAAKAQPAAVTKNAKKAS